MAKRTRRKPKAPKVEAKDSSGCCKMESIVGIDGRGQIVLPKEIRDKARIRAGDKMAVVSWEKDGAVCCIVLMRAQDLEGAVKGALSPVVKVVLKE